MRDEVLETARVLIQSAGVDGFSYADIAKQLDIRPPSIHHHFASKADLVAEVAELYRRDFVDKISLIQGETVHDRLCAYARLFDEPASSGLVCLCGAIAAEWPHIPDGARHHVEVFFAEQQTWLSEEIASGVASGEFRSGIDADAVAQLVLASLEGSMLMARAGTTSQLAHSTMTTLLSTLSR